MVTRISKEPAVATFRMEVLSETLVIACQITWCHNPQDHNQNLQYLENIKSHTGEIGS
jgi:hypothetical protein